jgi:hypothetical protein
MRMKPGRLAGGCIATTLMIAGTAVTGARPVSAATPYVCFPNHCYAVVDGGANIWNQATSPVYLTQVGADLEVDCLGVLNPTSDEQKFVNWEMWVLTNITSDTLPSPVSWLEEGIRDGSINRGTPGFGWFYAEQTPAGVYSENWVPTGNQGVTLQRKNVTFQYLGGSRWNIDLAGTVEATPTDNTGNAGGVQLGAEMSTDSQGQVNAHAWNWQYLPAGGSAWQSVAVSKTGYYPSNPVSYNLTWGADPTTGLLDETVHTTGPSQQCGNPVKKAQVVTQPWHPSLSAVRQVAAKAVAGRASGHVASATVVRTTRRAATALTSEAFVGPGSADSVYMVQETGSFTELVSSPGGTVTDHGRAVTIVIDAKTGSVLDWTIRPQAVKLSRLGPVAALAS